VNCLKACGEGQNYKTHCIQYEDHVKFLAPIPGQAALFRSFQCKKGLDLNKNTSTRTGS